MKKITLVLVTLAFVAAMAVAEDVTLSVSGSAEIEWGFAGQLIDNTGSFLDQPIVSGDFYASDDAGDLVNMDAPAFTFTMSVEDADGNVIVEAAANEIALDDNATTAFTWEEEFVSSLDYISFPNVVPGILGITLEDNDALEPAYAPYGSTSVNERILVNVTPIGDALDVTVGLLAKPDNKLMRTFYNGGVVAANGTFIWPDVDDDTFVESGSAALDANGWENGAYLSWAISLEATFTAALGDTDEVSVGIGAVVDSAFTNGVYEPDYGNDVDEMYSIFSEDVPLHNEALTQYVIDEVYGAIKVNPLSMKDEDHVTFGGNAADDTMLRTNEVRGRVTIPIGVGATAAVGDLSAAVDFQMALSEGLDEDNRTGIIDLTDATRSTFNYAAYAMPMYAAVDVGYELAIGDMTIAPNVNFKYSSDAWKWAINDDGDDYEYAGDVSGADFVGRPMSVAVGLDVEGIVGMIDVGLSAAMSLGDSVAGNHGLGLIPFNYTITHDAGSAETFVYDNTLGDLIDFWLVQPTLADSDANYWTAGTDAVAESGTDGMNNGFFASTATAMNIELSISAEPIDGLTISNTTAYEIDNAGIGGMSDDLTLYGAQLSSLSNETSVEYDWMVGDAVAFTIFGLFTYESINYVTEAGQKYIGLRADNADIQPDVFEFNYSEAPSMATFDYAVGVKCSVGL